MEFPGATFYFAAWGGTVGNNAACSPSVTRYAVFGIGVNTRKRNTHIRAATFADFRAPYPVRTPKGGWQQRWWWAIHQPLPWMAAKGNSLGPEPDFSCQSLCACDNLPAWNR